MHFDICRRVEQLKEDFSEQMRAMEDYEKKRSSARAEFLCFPKKKSTLG